ncbi:uncharacterized protein LOC122055776 [Zingiber officinale]|uniref:uncharacterized protein LOC122055776 n=1 Tax=Zingiber officinale TaxID=94328 RepID=UPI001C4D0E30|nr:uncharacterized protein LOC122055776 [Zingiber officinale]
MSREELFRSICADNAAAMGADGGASVSRQGSLALLESAGRKTAEEVCLEIGAGQVAEGGEGLSEKCDNRSSAKATATGSGSGSEDFLVRAGAVAEEDVGIPSASIQAGGGSNPAEQQQKKRIKQDKQYKLPFLLDYISYLSHLSVFGILGVYTRYLLQKLFGPDHLNLTGENNPLYLDLPSNMLGSFVMGWIGFVFKADILLVSDHLQVGLSTGYLGSLTTFSGWSQKMLESSSKGHWADAIAGFLLGIFLVNYSIILGIGCGGRLRKRVIGWCDNSTRRRTSSTDNFNKHVAILTVALLIWLSIWILSAEFFRLKLDDLSDSAVPWLAFLVGPPGVWTRWHLAGLNGQGLGRKRMLKWLPIGTLLANVLAACIVAALATISKEVNTKRCTIIVSGIQLGFPGCLSTVSAFAAEVYGMWEAGHGLNAFLYIVATITISFALGTLIYSVPVWIKDYR